MGVMSRMRGSRPLSRVAALLLAVVMLAALLPSTPPVARASELENLQRELEQLHRELDALLKKISTTHVQEKQVLADLAKIENQLDNTIAQLNRLERDLSYLQREITAAEADLAAAEAHLAKRQDYLGRRIRAIYEGGSVAYLEVLLGATSFADFLSRFDLLRQLVSKDNELLAAVREERAEVAARKAALEAKRARALGLQQQTTARKASIEYQQALKERYLEQVRQDRILYEQAVDEIEAMSKQIEEEIRRLAPWGKRPTGKLAYPVTSRTITSYFGMRFHPILRTYRLHMGIDFAAPVGTKVTAAEWGIVRRAETLGGYGKTVMLDHGGGLWTLYAHLSVISVSAGETVARGQLIGLVGSTGWSTGPHLHFEVRDNGTPIDPLTWLPK